MHMIDRMAKKKTDTRGGWARYPAQVQMVRISSEMRDALDYELDRRGVREADFVREALADALRDENTGAQTATQKACQTANSPSRHDAETA